VTEGRGGETDSQEGLKEGRASPPDQGQPRPLAASPCTGPCERVEVPFDYAGTSVVEGVLGDLPDAAAGQ
jgi:hypothetical protein